MAYYERGTLEKNMKNCIYAKSLPARHYQRTIIDGDFEAVMLIVGCSIIIKYTNTIIRV